MPSTDVYILGQKYTIKGESPEEHIRELARFIEERINGVCGSFPNITPTKALILTLFNVSEEIYRLKAEQEELTRHFEEKADILAGVFDEPHKQTLF